MGKSDGSLSSQGLEKGKDLSELVVRQAGHTLAGSGHSVKFQLLLVTCLVTGTLWAANDPFVGKWKLNPSRSKLTDQMKVESVGANKYTFDFGGGGAETIVADGTDQPGIFGTTLSVTVEGPDTWKVVRKKDGRTLITATWKLSKDGNWLTDDLKGVEPSGSTFNLYYVYQRTAGSSGFAGTGKARARR